MATLMEVDDQSFASIVLASPIPVLVDFWAEWCAPCVSIGRTLEELAPQYEGKVRIVKCNAEVAIETAASLGVRGLPHLVVLKAGKAVDAKLGNQNRAALEGLLKRHA
jgi:thioredoxin 1